ncbi:hypothetical protein PLCT2_01737 [Planctomycetaceae bacterium]|nr:hypothetical protein PLCT2_01737 [Planctomycetaceae bacterium]
MIRLVLLAALCLCSTLSAATLTVTNLNDSGAGSLRDTCAAAASGDAIVFQTGLAGTITFSSEINLGSKSLTITGNASGTGAPAITLQGSGLNRVLRQTGGTLTLSLFVVQLGWAATAGGGAILGNIVNCTGCTFSENVSNAGDGGAIYATASVTCTNCVFTNQDVVSGYGGAISCPSGLVTCTNCAVTGNGLSLPPLRGGAIYATGVTCTGCSFTSNKADSGGAINALGNITCAACTFSSNSVNLSVGVGGAAFSESSSFTDCAFSGNSASAAGAMFGYASTCTNCTFSGNSAIGGGGAISTADGAGLSCTNCTFAGNTADKGGAIISGSSVTLSGCTLSGNSATQGGCVFADVTTSSRTVLATNCVLADTGAGTMFASVGPVTFATGGYNICTRTLADVPWLNATGDQVATNPMLGTLQDNGGPVQTMRPLVGSPAIDKGGGNSTTTDARGRARPFDNPAIANATGGDGRDIGAVEFVFNSAPLITAPAALNIARDTPYSFAGTVSVADPDAASGAIVVALAAANGTVSLAALSGLTFSAGDGTADAAMTFAGTLTNINAALNGMTFTPTPAYLGAASLQIDTGDQGNTGDDATNLTDSETIALTVVELPEITLLRDGVEIVDGGGDNAYGAAGAPIARTFTIRNDGLSTLNIGAITFSNQVNCTVTVSAAPTATLAVSATTTFTLEITPTAEGAFSFDMQIASDDGDENPYNAHIVGTAKPASSGGNDNDDEEGCTTGEGTSFAGLLLVAIALLAARRVRRLRA